MDILGLIKDKLTDSVIEKVSGFLGEHPEKIGPALNSAVPIVMGGIIRSASTEEGAGKVMDVLKDGGHTGEILDDLPTLLGNFDKTQLLITIGSNIFNHFSGNKGNSIVEKLSTLNDVRKTSASSLVGLAAPLVLGALGKVVGKEGLGVSGLSKLLSEQRETVFGALPPAIANQLSFKNTSTPAAASKEEKPKEEKPASTGGGGFMSWIPWVLIGLLFLGVIGYFLKYRKSTVKEPETPTVSVLPKQDSTFVSDSAFVALPPDTSSNEFTAPIETPKVEETKPSEIVEKETKKEEKQAKKEEKATKLQPVEKKVEASPKTDIFENSGSLSVADLLKNSKSWIGLNTDFRKNSAEVSSKGQLDDVAKYLKNNRKAKAVIAGGSQSSGSTLAEDRAYAVREVLFEKGVSESQLSVQSSVVKDVNAKVVVKIKR
jgi:outer membrane protein OmpA-like peptidoglycan-associated protein